MISQIDNTVLRRIFGEVEIETMLKKMKGKKLKQTERNYLYRSIRPKIAAALALCNSGLPALLQQKWKDETALIEYNLGLYGVPLFSTKRARQRKLPLEQLIIRILSFPTHARHIEAAPLLLAKNHADQLKLLELAIQSDCKNKLGYILETAQLLKYKEEYRELLRYLKQTKDRKIEALVEGDEDFLTETSPKRVKSWNLLGRFFDEDFRRNAEAYL
jgi:hypothetical protein